LTPLSVQESVDRTEKRISVALPVRVTYYDSDSKPRLEMACTYDISSHGARLTGLRCVKEAGEIVTIERGRSKAFCRIVWIGEATSHLQGQVGIQCVEAEKMLWSAELNDMGQMYDAVIRDPRRSVQASCEPGNRRRFTRFGSDGSVELLHKGSGPVHLKGDLKDVSEVGCLATTKSLLLPGTDLKLVLNVANYDLVFKGQVRHAALDVGLGIEFREVRKGDRAVLQHLLQKIEHRHKSKEKADKHKASSAGSRN
jgi:PilZ domain-containing protein